MTRVSAVASSVRVEQVDIVPDGIIVRFHNQESAFIEGKFLYDSRDVNGNYPLGEDKPE